MPFGCKQVRFHTFVVQTVNKALKRGKELQRLLNVVASARCSVETEIRQLRNQIQFIGTLTCVDFEVRFHTFVVQTVNKALKR